MKKDYFQGMQGECKMMTKRFLFLLILLWAMTACASHPAWQGSYVYEADLGENAADQSILVEYILEIGDNSCRLSIQGYQVSEIILCDASGNAHSLGVKFMSYDDGSLKNVYGIQLYSSRQVLFRLSAEKELITHWDGLLPDESLVKSGKYFLKKAQ